jgi:transposase
VCATSRCSFDQQLVESYAPQLLAERGCGPLTAAKLNGEIAGANRFASDSKLARTGGARPPASSGNTVRHRLDPGGNRQLNYALHRLAVNLRPLVKWVIGQSGADA